MVRRRRADRLRGRGHRDGVSVDILRRGFSYVPQGRCNFPAMSVEENLEMGAYLRRTPACERDIEALLTRFPMLADKRREPAGTLSGGQQQILEMAIALLLHPRLLLVDEPSLGLDPRMVEAVFDDHPTINRDGTTVLMVEQNAKQALSRSPIAGSCSSWVETASKAPGRRCSTIPMCAALPRGLASHTALGARWRLFRDRQPPATGRCPGSR